MKVRGGIVTFKHKRGYYRLRHLQKLQAVGVEVKVKKERGVKTLGTAPWRKLQSISVWSHSQGAKGRLGA